MILTSSTHIDKPPPISTQFRTGFSQTIAGPWTTDLHPGAQDLSYINSTKPRENYKNANFRVAPAEVASLRFYRFRPEIEKTPKFYK